MSRTKLFGNQKSNKKKVSSEEVNAFLDKYGYVDAGTAETSVLVMRDTLRNIEYLSEIGENIEQLSQGGW